MRSYRLLSIPLGLCILGLVLAGCTDQMLTDEPAASPETAQPPASAESSKVVYPHLLDRSAYSEKSLLGDLLPGLIIGFRDTSYTPSKLFQRYKFLQRYDFDTREFDEVFSGIALLPDPDQLGLRWWLDLGRFLSMVEDDAGIAWIAPDLNLTLDPVEVIPTQRSGEVTPWGLERIGAESPVDASGVDLYVIDTGVQTPDLTTGAHLNFSASSGNGDADGHGTHVAGTAAAQHNGMGVMGVASNARVFNAKVFDDEGTAKSSAVLTAMDDIIARKRAHPDRPTVVNLSLGANVGSRQYGPLDFAVEEAVEAGIVVVVAAGNSRINASTVTPAHADAAITVGAYDPLNLFAAFSNYGPAVDILAPGVEIESLLPSDGDETRTGKMSGTSMAAPHVAGAAARYLARHPSAAPQEVRAAIVSTSRARINGTPSNTTNRTVWVGASDGTTAAMN